MCLIKVLRIGYFDWIFAPQKWRNFAIALRSCTAACTIIDIGQSLDEVFGVVDCVNCLESETIELGCVMASENL